MARTRTAGYRKPSLRSSITPADFRAYYWLKAELERFARRLGLDAAGSKPEITRRIERKLLGRPAERATRRPAVGERDSTRPLTRRTPVVHYKSDDATRAFFESEIGPHFHFTYHVNQFRLRQTGLTYGDLIDEWCAEHKRRKSESYTAPIAHHGEYNRHIRDFFADPQNAGKPFLAAVASWNTARHKRRHSPEKPTIRRS